MTEPAEHSLAEIPRPRTFLARVPEIMERGGFTIETAIEQAYREDLKFCVEMSNGRTERAQLARQILSARIYQRLRDLNHEPEFNENYLAYCAAHGHTPFEQMAADNLAYPGGCMTGYICWIQKRGTK